MWPATGLDCCSHRGGPLFSGRGVCCDGKGAARRTDAAFSQSPLCGLSGTFAVGAYELHVHSLGSRAVRDMSPSFQVPGLAARVVQVSGLSVRVVQASSMQPPASGSRSLPFGRCRAAPLMRSGWETG